MDCRTFDKHNMVVGCTILRNLTLELFPFFRKFIDRLESRIERYG